MGNGENDFRRDRATPPVAAGNELNPIRPPIFGSGLSRIFGKSRSGIGLRLLAGVLLFSSAVTLALTALQLYLEYEREVGVIESRLDEIGRSYPDSLGESLWNLDQNQLDLQLKGILSLPDVQSVEIREIASRANPVRLALGQRATRSVIAREYPLDYVMQGGRRQIGVLRVETTLTEVYRQLLNKALVILASQAAKTFLVSFFILYLFHLLVTRHLVAVAEFVSDYNLARPPPPLRLDRRPPREADELDKVIEAFNGLCTSLQHAYGDVRQANARLERDLSVRRQAEEDVRQSEQRFRDYAETASDWFWETGPDHAFTYISERLDAFGMDRASLIGKRRFDVAVGPEAEPQKWRAHVALLERHEPFRNFEYDHPDTTGRSRHVSVNGRPVFAADGRFLGYRGTGTDLTKQHEAEERLRQSQKMDAIGQLTGGVAHDFNNVLTVITGTIEILQDGLADKPQLAAIAQLIDDAATRGASITSQLLTFARRQPLEPREIEINGLVMETAKLLMPMLGEHVEIETVLARRCLGRAGRSLAADGGHRQSRGQCARCHARRRQAHDRDRQRDVSTRPRASTDSEMKPGQFVMIAVGDTGHGIPADIRDRVFEPFFTTKGVGRGTGLGLSMVYGFAKQTGGTVRIDSEEGRGTSVKLYLPRAEGVAARAGDEPLSTPAVPLGQHETILVVEDDALVRGYVIAQLGGLGYRTLVASDGAAALALVEQGAEFDLLFTDVVMPGRMNGRQLADAVVARRPGMKVLYTSGYSDDAIVHEGHLDPGLALLKKPYRKADLAQKIREVLGSL